MLLTLDPDFDNSKNSNVFSVLRQTSMVLAYADDLPPGPDHEGHACGEVAAARAHIKGPHPRLQVILQDF